MIAQHGFRYVTPEGSFTTLGLQLFAEQEARIAALEAKLAAVAAVAAPAGGATVDAEARAAVAAIITGAG